MKLRLKISLLFGVLLLASLSIIGTVYNVVNRSAVQNSVHQGMETSSILAEKQLSELLDTYCNMIEVTGRDALLMSDASGEELGERISEIAAQYQFTSGNILDKNGVSYKDGTDFSDREYVKKALKGQVNISDITLSKLTGKYGFSVAGPLYDVDGAIKGVVYFRMDVDFMHAILNRIKASENGYSYLVDGSGLVIVHPNDELIGQLNISESKGELASVAEALKAGECGLATYTFEGVAVDSYYIPVENTNGWGLVVVVPSDDYLVEINETNKRVVGLEILVLAVSVIFAVIFASGISKKTRRVVELMKKLSAGDFSDDLTPTNKKDEIAELQNAACGLRDTFVGLVKDESRVLSAIVNYDLTESEIKGYQGEFKKLADAVNSIKYMLSSLIKQIQVAAEEVNVGSREIAKATEHLSQGAVSQASSIELMTANIQDMADRVAKSADNEKMVEESLDKLDELIQSGNYEMQNLFSVIQNVEEMSNDIQSIIKLIDSIAFQTNILALNASVEAARAGDSGKGFAVVADEIGSLADRAGAASKQTAELIEQCIKGIKNATESAKTTTDYLDRIVANSQEINAAFTEIAEDTMHQAEKSATIKDAIQDVSNVVSTNTATAVETAASTEELSGQSESMSNMVKRFRI